MKRIKQIYDAPQTRCICVELQQCIALSGGNESYSSDAGGYDANGNEDLTTDNGAW